MQMSEIGILDYLLSSEWIAVMDTDTDLHLVNWMYI